MNRAKRATEMFSPVRELTARMTSRTDLVSSLTNIWSMRTDSPIPGVELALGDLLLDVSAACRPPGS